MSFVRLGDYTTKIGSGQTPSGGYRAYSPSGIPLIRSQNVLMGSFSTDGLAYISAQIDEEMSGTRVVKDDVLLNITGASIGRVCVVPDDFCPANVNQHVCIIRCGDALYPGYVAAVLSSPSFQSMIWQDQAGATRQALTKDMIENFQIPWKPFEEQRLIAARLKAQLAEVATARKAAQAQLRDAALLRRSVLQSAFDLLLSSFDRECCLKDVCSISAGGTPSRSNAAFFTGQIPWVKTLDLNFGLVRDTEEKISQEAFHSIRGELLPVGTVMVAMYGGAGTIGKSGVLGIEACTNQAVCALQPHSNELDSEFLHEWLCYIRPEWMRLAGGNRKDPNINKAIVENMTLPLPPIDTQRHIVTALKQQLAEADDLRTALEQQLSDLDALPQRILAQAFEN